MFTWDYPYIYIGKGSSSMLAQKASYLKGKTECIVGDIGFKTEFTSTTFRVSR